MSRNDSNSPTRRDWQRVHDIGRDHDPEAQGLMRWASYGAAVLLAMLAGAALLAFGPYFLGAYGNRSETTRTLEFRQAVQSDIVKSDSGTFFLIRAGAGAGIGAVVGVVVMATAAKELKKRRSP